MFDKMAEYECCTKNEDNNFNQILQLEPCQTIYLLRKFTCIASAIKTFFPVVLSVYVILLSSRTPCFIASLSDKLAWVSVFLAEIILNGLN